MLPFLLGKQKLKIISGTGSEFDKVAPEDQLYPLETEPGQAFWHEMDWHALRVLENVQTLSIILRKGETPKTGLTY